MACTSSTASIRSPITSTSRGRSSSPRRQFDAWPRRLQQVMRAAVRDAMATQRKVAEQEDTQSRNAILAAGCEIVEAAAIDHASFVKAVQPLLDEARGSFGDDLLALATARRAARIPVSSKIYSARPGSIARPLKSIAALLHRRPPGALWDPARAPAGVRHDPYPCCSTEDVAMRNYDFTPLWRSSIGFDRLFDLINSQIPENQDGYPPYDSCARARTAIVSRWRSPLLARRRRHHGAAEPAHRVRPQDGQSRPRLHLSRRLGAGVRAPLQPGRPCRGRGRRLRERPVADRSRAPAAGNHEAATNSKSASTSPPATTASRARASKPRSANAGGGSPARCGPPRHGGARRNIQPFDRRPAAPPPAHRRP